MTVTLNNLFMKKSNYKLLLAFILLLIVGSAVAQENDRNVLKRSTLFEQNSFFDKIKERIPYFIAPIERNVSPMKTVKQIVPNGQNRRIIGKRANSVAPNLELWANVIGSNEWMVDSVYTPKYGMYSFMSNERKMSAVHVSDSILAVAGGVYVGNDFHVFSLSHGYTINYYDFDMTDWSCKKSKTITDMSFLMLDMAQNPTNGMVYGIAYKSDFTGFELVNVDLSTLKKTSIGDLGTVSLPFESIDFDAIGTLYGICADGNLYTIDPNTASTTLVGSLGVKPATLTQSADIDPNTGIMYWAALLDDGSSKLMTVNTNNGSASEIGSFPYSEQIACLHIPAQEPDGALPDSVTNADLYFQGVSLDGTVSFNMPTKTIDGTDITESLKYCIILNGDTAKVGSANAGSRVINNITMKVGRNVFQVFVSNSKGVGRLKLLSKWGGFDTPESVGKVNLSIDAHTKEATVTWHPSKRSEHDGYINLSSLKYRVVRYPDSVSTDTVVDTTYTEVLPEGVMASYYYEVTPFYDDTHFGPTSKSNSVIGGAAMKVPYCETFDTPDVMNTFTVIDHNNDSKTWKYNKAYKCVNTIYSSSRPADDWLITPSIALKAGLTYTFTFQYKSSSKIWKEKLLVGYGLGTDTTNYKYMSDTLVFRTKDKQYTTFTKKFKVDADGEYNFGFHAVSDKFMDCILVDSICVDDGVKDGAPDSVRNIIVTPADKGELSAKITFTLPTVDVSGNALTSLTKAIIYRDDKAISTITGPKPGATLDYTDTQAANGFNKYTVVAHNKKGAGFKSSVSAWVGIDIPAAISYVHAVDNGSSVSLSWNAPTSAGIHGGYVDANELTYNIYNQDGNLVKGSNPNCTFDDTSVNLTGTQSLLYYGVAAVSEIGQGSITSSNALVKGDPYQLPFIESFPKGKTANAMWWVEKNGTNNFATTTSIDYDLDNGCIYWMPAAAGESGKLNSGKVLVKGTNPKLRLAYIAYPGKDAKMTIRAIKNSTDTITLSTINYKDLTGSASWRKLDIPISNLADARYVVFQIEATSNDVKVPIVIDDFEAYDVKQKDVRCNVLTTPYIIEASTEGNVTTLVSNIGEEVAPSVKIRLFSDDKEVGAWVMTNVAANSDTKCSLPIVPDATKDKIIVSITADYDGDMDLTNNSTLEKEINVAHSLYPTVQLNGSYSGNQMNLSWTAPDVKNGATVTDDFENYAPWLTDGIGKWTTIDGDGKPTVGITDFTFPNSGKPMSFITFCPSEAGYTLDQYPYDLFTMHSGKQALAHFNCLYFSKDTDKDDDWLISPLLSGKQQTINLYALSSMDSYLEDFDVLYSTTDNDTASFKLLETFQSVPADWTNYTATLPEGTKYFAIHVTSMDKFYMMFDDITYTAAPLQIKSYNIYENGSLIGNTANTNYSISNASFDNIYNVSVVYSDVESKLSNSVTGTTGINDVQNSKSKADSYFDLSGRRINAPQHGVTIIKMSDGTVVKKAKQ